MNENDVLQIVVFSLIFALAATAWGTRSSCSFRESLSEVMFKFTNYVKFAPYGVGAAMAVTVGSKGSGSQELALLILTLYGRWPSSSS
jgi:proton glutamate symport protein